MDVRGGIGGIEAHCDDMVAAARHFGRAATDTGEQTLALHRYLVDPQVLASAPLDPPGAASFEAALLDALDGPHGLTALAARAGSIDLALRGAAASYLAADRLDEAITPELSAAIHLPGALADALPAAATGDWSGAGSKLLADDPALVDAGLNGVAAATGGSVSKDAFLLGELYDDGHPLVTPLGTDPDADAAGPPRSLADLVTELTRRDDQWPGDIDVRILDETATGPRQVIVDIPGTKDWSLLARHNPDVTSPVTNLRALAGESTTYERGVLAALAQAGVRPDDDVLLIGQSQGGLIAVNAATHTAATGQFHISHVITLGSPIGALAARVPTSVQVLAVENSSDVVPHLDGAENPDRVNVVTATVRHKGSSVIDNHGLQQAYLPGAEDIDACDNPSIQAFLGGMTGFLSGQTVTTAAFGISRGY
ncbi:MAG: hypothetical protein FWD74_06565 [Actinomycetia bacterium]|nr:hypothetical protein [Actinomycetes bacterium]